MRFLTRYLLAGVLALAGLFTTAPEANANGRSVGFARIRTPFVSVVRIGGYGFSRAGYGGLLGSYGLGGYGYGQAQAFGFGYGGYGQTYGAAPCGQAQAFNAPAYVAPAPQVLEAPAPIEAPACGSGANYGASYGASVGIFSGYQRATVAGYGYSRAAVVVRARTFVRAERRVFGVRAGNAKVVKRGVFGAKRGKAIGRKAGIVRRRR